MSEENKLVSEFFVEEKKVVEVLATEDKTPLGDVIFEVKFEEGPSQFLTRAKFECVRTVQKSDATSARNELVKEIGQKMYAIMCEYGVKLSEIDPVLNETVRLTNDNQNHAINLLWGNEAYDRSLLDVNRVLLSNYDPSESKEVDPAPKGDDAVASDGGTPDTADKDKV